MDWGLWPRHLTFTSHRFHEMGTTRKYHSRKQIREAAKDRGYVLHYLGSKGRYIPYHWERPPRR